MLFCPSREQIKELQFTSNAFQFSKKEEREKLMFSAGCSCKQVHSATVVTYTTGTHGARENS